MIKFFENIPEVLAVMSEREDGSMKVFKDSDFNLENRQRFFEKIGIDKDNIIAGEIVHGTSTAVVGKNSSGIILGADGLATNNKNVFLSVTVADCIPVYFYEPVQKIVSIAHCGWHGIVDGIVKNSVKKVFDLGGQAENLKVALGPGINVCHFEIKKDVLEKFDEYPEFILERDCKIFVDLKGIIKKQLTESQVNPKNIENDAECTFEGDRYFSFRRDKPETVEAMVAVIGMRN